MKSGEVLLLMTALAIRLFFCLSEVKDVLPDSPAVDQLAVFSDFFVQTLRGRFELVTPVTDIENIKEGVFLRRVEGSSPYSGSLVHQPPVVLSLFAPLLGVEYQHFLPLLFVALDFVVAFLLYQIAKLYRAEEGECDNNGCVKSIYASLSEERIVLLYLLNPFTIVSCAVQSTEILSQVGMLLSLLAALKGRGFMAGLWLAWATYCGLYPIQLIFSLGLVLNANRHLEGPAIVRVVMLLFGLLLGLAGLLCYSEAWMRNIAFEDFDPMVLLETKSSSLEWIDQCYMFLLEARDLRPNIGLFWYFFSEVFTHFRVLFLWCFQLHAFVYALPIVVRFPKRPVFCFWSTLAIFTSFKSYPSAADLGLQWALIPMFSIVVREMGSKFLLPLVVYVVLAFLGSVTMHTWMYSYAGNANFVYAGTLILSVAQTFLIAESMRGVLVHDYRTKHKIKHE